MTKEKKRNKRLSFWQYLLLLCVGILDFWTCFTWFSLLRSYAGRISFLSTYNNFNVFYVLYYLFLISTGTVLYFLLRGKKGEFKNSVFHVIFFVHFISQPIFMPFWIFLFGILMFMFLG